MCDGPSYIELRARGDRREDEADLLAFVAWLLAKVGFESHPCETYPPAREVILPANWRELPVVAAAIASTYPPGPSTICAAPKEMS